MRHAGYSDHKNQALEAIAKDAKEAPLKVIAWCGENYHRFTYSSGQSLYQTLNLAIQADHPTLRGLIRVRGTLRLRTAEDLEAGKPGRERFSFGIPKDPPDHKVRVSLSATPKDPKPEKEEKVERKSPRIRFSDAYVEGMAQKLKEGKRYDLDLDPIADMLEELLDLRKKHGVCVKLVAEQPSQRGSLGNLTF